MRHLIVAEDNDLDVERLRRQLKKLDIGGDFLHVGDGEAALDALGELAAASVAPITLLADLNMPRMSGWELIDAVRNDGRFAAVRIFVCTTSTHPSDLEQAEAKQIDGYLVKPVCAEDLAVPLGLAETSGKRQRPPDGSSADSSTGPESTTR